MLQLFGIDWVIPGSVVDLLFCWYHWLRKHSFDIWNLVPGCLMWIIWTEWNLRSFEDKGKTVVQLLDLGQRTLFEWFSGYLCLFVHYHELFVFSCYSFINNIFFLLIQKKKKRDQKSKSLIIGTLPCPNGISVWSECLMRSETRFERMRIRDAHR